MQAHAPPRGLGARLVDGELLRSVNHVIIVSGSNGPKDTTLDTFKREFTSVLDKLVSSGKPLTVSSILPCSIDVMQNITAGNTFAKAECDRLGARFIANDKNFLFRDVSRNHACFLRVGPQLSSAAMQRLLSNLSLGRAPSGRRGRPHHRRQPPKANVGTAVWSTVPGVICRFRWFYL